MKRFLFLLMMLLLVSLLSCSNSNDKILGPDTENQVQADQEQSAPSGAQTDVILTGDGGDGDPWEDNDPEGGGQGGPQKPPIIGPPDGGGGKDTLPDPNIEP